MKKTSGTFTLVELCFVIIIILILAVVSIPICQKAVRKANIGRNITEPTVGQVYVVMAGDKTSNTVVAMPWCFRNDKPEMTDRRVLLRVSSIVCRSGLGTCFCLSSDNRVNIVSLPPELRPTFELLRQKKE